MMGQHLEDPLRGKDLLEACVSLVLQKTMKVSEWLNYFMW
jgi:hypothetical protein